MIKAVAFDIGGVIVPSFVTEFYAAALTATGATQQQFRAAMDLQEKALERGVIDDELFWRHVGAALGREDTWPALSKAWYNTHARARTINPQFLALYERLRAKYAVGCLSNTQEPHVSTNRTLGIYSRFDPCVLSSEHGVAKPEPAIYALFAQQARLQTSEVLFIDDKQAYVDAAKAAGMQAVRYEYGEDLEMTLRGAGLVF